MARVTVANINQVAQMAGVSTATVSRALSGHGGVSPKRAERVRVAAEALGYVPSTAASALASGRSMSIGVVTPSLKTWYYAAVLDGIQQRLTGVGFDLVLYCVDDDEVHREKIFKNLLPRQRIDGVINITVPFTAEELANFEHLGKPVVSMGRDIEHLNTICIDDFEAGALATEHLISLGHRAIGHIGANTISELDITQPNLRTSAYQKTMAKHALTIVPGWVKISDFTMEGGYNSAMAILSGEAPRPTAIFASSDEMAFGVLNAANTLGLSVPGDLSVVGIDNHPLSHFYKLTTIAQDAEAQGDRCAELLLDVLAAKSESQQNLPTHETWPVRLIERQSTGGITP